MSNMRYHFAALLKKINPPKARVDLASERVGDLRGWLQDHDFATKDPHNLRCQ